MDLGQAVSKHAEWKTRFRTAITKNEAMDATTIARDNLCELGKWLHGDARSQFGTLASYRDCVAKHAAFHAEASKVAQAINARKFSEADAMLNSGTGDSTASTAVGVAIMPLQKEAGL